MSIKILEEYVNKINLIEDLDENTINKITDECLYGFEADIQSRKDWEDEYSKWMKLATQISEQKTWPWRNASNVKYPLVATAAMQFAARAYPSLVPDTKAVSMRVWGQDPTSEKRQRAERVSQHMSYQVLEQMEGWKQDMDKLCYILPIVGVAFKKTYYDYYKQQNCSQLVYPKDFVVDYWTTNINTAYRKTHILYLTENEIKERQRKGLYINGEEYKPFREYRQVTTLHDETLNRQQHQTSSYLEDTSITIPILEIHTWYDLDGDDYAEPYILTFDWAQKKLIRMVVGFSLEDVEHNGNEIQCIHQTQYFTKFEFIPNPDGGFYSLGFGALLGPLNETTNTLINQLIDSGTLYNLQAGFLSKGLRIKGGNQDFSPGEWKVVNPVGDDLKKGIFPLPVREPSQVLFNLLGTIVESGNKLASVAEIFVGEMPGQNTPATTTMATIEQGMKVFTAIYKRIYEALTQEFRKLYKLNKQYVNSTEYYIILDTGEEGQVSSTDYDGDDTDIRPAGDPKAATDATKLLKAQAIMELMKLGTINPQWATMKLADAMSIDDVQEGMQQPPPDPKQQEMQMKAQLEQQKAEMKTQMDAAKLQMEVQKQQNDLMVKEKMAALDAQQKQMELQYKALELQMKLKEAQLSSAMDMMAKGAEHEQKMKIGDEQHKLKMKQLEEKEQQMSKKKRKTKIKEGADGSFEVIDEDVEETPKKKKSKITPNKDGSYSVEEE